MALETAHQNGSARTNLPEKLIRPGRESELNGVKNNPRFWEKFKVMNAPNRRIVESEGSDSDSYDVCSDTSELDAQISLFSSVREVEPGRSTTIRDFIKDVKEGRWKEQVGPLQQLIRDNKRKGYDEGKRALSGVTLSAACASRSSNLSPEAKAVVHSGWLQADFDLKDNSHLTDAEAVQNIRQNLLSDSHVGAVFCGPSGEGIKAIVRINGERHQDSWLAAEAYFLGKHGLRLDKATKDPLRLCFVSYDLLAGISEEFSPLPIPEVKKTTQETWYPPLETTASDIAEMLQFIPKRPEYETWLRVASAVWSVLPMAEGCRLLAQWSPEEADGEYATKHKHRLEQVGIGTLCHIAAQHGFDAKAAWKRKRWAGRIRFAPSAYHPAEGEDPASDTAPQGIITERDISREQVIDALRDGQIGDAKLWTDIRQGLRVWNIHSKNWMIYEEGIWKRDEGGTTIWDISRTLCRISDAVIKSVEKEIAINPAKDLEKDSRNQDLKVLKARRKLFRGRDYLKNVDQLAAAKLQLPATAFDAQPELLAVENGTLDFAEGIFREHRPTDYLTHKADITFDPAAKCPVWDKFLDYFMGGDRQLIAYLARAVGYCLTGRVHEDALFFCYGKGANGKSTFFGGLQLLLKNLMTTVKIAALLEDRLGNSCEYYKAAMQGCRVVVTEEIPEGKRRFIRKKSV